MKHITNGIIPLIGVFFAVLPAHALTQGEYNQQVDQRLKEGIEQMLVKPWPPQMTLALAFATALRDGASPELNKKVLAAQAAYKMDPAVDPNMTHRPPDKVIYNLYLKPDMRKLLSPEAVAAIEDMCWRWVYRHSFLKDPFIGGRVWPYNNLTLDVWHLVGSENIDSNIRLSTLLSLQVLMRAPKPYGPAAKLHDGHTVEEHYKAWVAFYRDSIRGRARAGLDCEIAHPTTYGKILLSNYHKIEDLTDDAELKDIARKYLDLYWAYVATEFEPRTGSRGIASTRCKGVPALQQSANWAIPLQAAWGWTDKSDPPNLTMASIFSSSYRPPLILKAIASDPNRGPYLSSSRRFGLGPQTADNFIYTIEFADGEQRNSYIRRDVWYTPDYCMSALSLDLNRSYIEMVDQSRVVGVTFSTSDADRLAIYGSNAAEARNRKAVVATSRTINSVQRPDCLVAARDPNVEERKSDRINIFISKEALWDNRTEAGGWTFTRSGDGYLAFRIAGDKGFTITESIFKFGQELGLNDVWAPVVVQMGRAETHGTFEAFMSAVQAQPFTYADDKLTYTTLAGDTIEYWSKSNVIPHVNGKELNLNPEYTFHSPFLKMKHGTNKAVISCPGHEDVVLEF